MTRTHTPSKEQYTTTIQEEEGENVAIKINYVVTNRCRVGKRKTKAPFPSSTLAQLVAQTPKEMDGETVVVQAFDESMGPYDLEEERPDILGVSSLTPGIPRAYELMDRASNMESLNGRRIATITGGVHATSLPLEALKHADKVVRGEMPQEFQHFVLNQALTTPSRKEVYRLHDIPCELIHPPVDWTWTDTSRYYARLIQRSTGCPEGCSFCSVTQIMGAMARYVPEGNFIEEVDQTPQNVVIALSDDNLIHVVNDECIDRLIRVAQILRERKRRWVGEVGLKKLRDAQAKVKKDRGIDLIALLAENGLVGLFFGVESVDDDVDLRKAIPASEAIDLIRYCRSCGISVLGAFVLGIGPNETPEYRERVLEFAIEKANLDLIQVTIATPLPGSLDFLTAYRDGTLLHRGWENYDGTHCVFKHPTMSADQLEESLAYLYQEFYRGRSIIQREVMAPFLHHGAREFARRAWMVPINLALGYTARKWGERNEIIDSVHRGTYPLEPEVISQLDQALEENPEKPALFDIRKPETDRISTLC